MGRLFGPLRLTIGFRGTARQFAGWQSLGENIQRFDDLPRGQIGSQALVRPAAKRRLVLSMQSAASVRPQRHASRDRGAQSDDADSDVDALPPVV